MHSSQHRHAVGGMQSLGLLLGAHAGPCRYASSYQRASCSQQCVPVSVSCFGSALICFPFPTLIFGTSSFGVPRCCRAVTPVPTIASLCNDLELRGTAWCWPRRPAACTLLPGPVCAGRGVLPAADGEVCSGGCVCACVWGLNRYRFRAFGLLSHSVPALPCPAFITGAGGLPRRLGFCCMCAAQVPVAPTVGAVSLCLVPRWHRERCACGVLVGCMYSGMVGGSPSMGRVALFACFGGLAFVVGSFGGFLP